MFCQTKMNIVVKFLVKIVKNYSQEISAHHSKLLWNHSLGTEDDLIKSSYNYLHL